MIKTKEIESGIRKDAMTVLGRVLLFLFYYVGLILLGIGLIVAAFFLSILLFDVVCELRYINSRILLGGGLLWIAMCWFCIQIAWYLIKPLFMVNRNSDENRREVSQEECPELFSMIEDVAYKTGNKMPRHVYLSAELNACVFYESTSVWSIFFPTRKSLMVGTGLLYGLSENELKAIIAHEFGHFSQRSMKVGTITYRLLLIIRGMIELTQEEQRKAALSRTASDTKAMFHVAGGAMGYITNQTIKFYKYIEKKNCSLSRYMEFEADAVACRIVGAESFISSLCKLEVLSERNDIYENVIARLLQEKKYIKDYKKGYEIVDSLVANVEKVHISYDRPLATLVNKPSKFPSKITMADNWSTHPSTAERIEYASQFARDSLAVEQQDARKLVCSSVLDKVGFLREHAIYESIGEPAPWKEMTEMPMNEFLSWATEQLEQNYVSNYFYPFLKRSIVHFERPSDEEMAEVVDSPFTEKNRDLLLEYSTALSDWNILNDWSSTSEYPKFLYDGSEYEHISYAMIDHKKYLDRLQPKLADFERTMFIYLCQQTGNKDGVARIYGMVFYSNSSINAMRDILELSEAIKQQTKFYYEQDKPFSLSDNIRLDLLEKTWKFLRKFDYQAVDSVCGEWKYRGEPIRNLLRQWYSFATAECDYSMTIDSVIHLVDDVYKVLAQMHDVGKAWLEGFVKQVYEGKGDI